MDGHNLIVRLGDITWPLLDFPSGKQYAVLHPLTAEMESATERTPLAFGVEIECVTPYVTGETIDPEPDGVIHELAPLLRLSSDEVGEYLEHTVHEKMHVVFERHGIPVDRKLGLAGWLVKGDHSVWDGVRMGYDGICTVEIVSPPMWAIETAFRWVHYVVAVLTTNFRVRVNMSCGLHVHVSRGIEREFSHRDLRRFGALAWASEDALSCLHPPERRLSTYCQPLRRMSALALDSLAQVDAYIYHDESLTSGEEEELKDQSPTSFRPLREDPAALQELTNPDRPRRRILAIDPVQDERSLHRQRSPRTFGGCTLSNHLDIVADGNMSALEGAQRLLAAKNRTHVALLLEGYSKLGWNFLSWVPKNDPVTRLTVENRTAQGSVNHEWIEIWTRIVVGVAQFAVDAPKSDFSAVVERLDAAERAEREQGAAHVCKYDVTDFLGDIGLAVEGVYVARRILPNPEKFWFPHHPEIPEPREDAYFQYYGDDDDASTHGAETSQLDRTIAWVASKPTVLPARPELLPLVPRPAATLEPEEFEP